MFVHSVPKWPFTLSNILFLASRACDQISHVARFTVIGTRFRICSSGNATFKYVHQLNSITIVAVCPRTDFLFEWRGAALFACFIPPKKCATYQYVTDVWVASVSEDRCFLCDLTLFKCFDSRLAGYPLFE